MDAETYHEINDALTQIQNLEDLTVDQRLKILEIRTLTHISSEIASVATQLVR